MEEPGQSEGTATELGRATGNSRAAARFFPNANQDCRSAPQRLKLTVRRDPRSQC